MATGDARALLADALGALGETLRHHRDLGFTDLPTGGDYLLGPAEAPVFRLKGYYRYHFQLQSPSAAQLHRVLRDVVATVRPPASVEFQIDVDPFNML